MKSIFLGSLFFIGNLFTVRYALLELIRGADITDEGSLACIRCLNKKSFSVESTPTFASALCTRQGLFFSGFLPARQTVMQSEEFNVFVLSTSPDCALSSLTLLPFCCFRPFFRLRFRVRLPIRGYGILLSKMSRRSPFLRYYVFPRIISERSGPCQSRFEKICFLVRLLFYSIESVKHMNLYTKFQNN